MLQQGRYYLPTMVSVALGSGFGIALIDTIEALIFGNAEMYVTTGAICIVLLIAGIFWLRWRNELTS